MAYKCYWCGDTKAKFYHVACAQEMSTSNCKMYSEIVADYQKQNKALIAELTLCERRNGRLTQQLIVLDDP